MQLLKRETTIPALQVHAFHANLDNSLGYPYILMDFPDGFPLPTIWFDQGIPEKLLEQRRWRAFQELAEVTV